MVMRTPVVRTPHKIEAVEGAFKVTSANSGRVYYVDATNGNCQCIGFGKRRTCSHLDDVLVEADRILKEKTASA